MALHRAARFSRSLSLSSCVLPYGRYATYPFFSRIGLFVASLVVVVVEKFFKTLSSFSTVTLNATSARLAREKKIPRE